MSDKTIAERIIDLTFDQLGVPIAQIKPESKFIDDLGADSLDTVEIVMALEEEFDIDIPNEDAQGLQTVAAVTEYITGRLG